MLFCSVILLHCESFSHENKFLVCVNTPDNKAHSDSEMSKCWYDWLFLVKFRSAHPMDSLLIHEPKGEDLSYSEDISMWFCTSVTSFAVLHGSRRALKSSFGVISLILFSDWWRFIYRIMCNVLFHQHPCFWTQLFLKKCQMKSCQKHKPLINILVGHSRSVFRGF